jgi:DNA-directed RNA polymerase specialized sigma24 family protein
MTGETLYMDLVKSFDSFFADKYSKLLNEAVSITQHYDYSADMVNDAYLKVRQRIWNSGYTGNNYHGFVWQSISNEWKVLCNRKKIRTFIDIHDEENHFDDVQKAEEVLLENKQLDDLREEQYQKIEFIVRMLFRFIETNYGEKQSYLFKTYFLCGDTYEQLSKRTGVNIAIISKTIKPMKKDLKYNFETYLKNNL